MHYFNKEQGQVKEISDKLYMLSKQETQIWPQLKQNNKQKIGTAGIRLQLEHKCGQYNG